MIFNTIFFNQSQYVSISRSYFMHKKPESDLFPLDTELERTLMNLRKVRSTETTIMADERIGQIVEQETAAERPPMQDTMEDFWRPVIQEEYSAVRQPSIEANNF